MKSEDIHIQYVKDGSKGERRFVYYYFLVPHSNVLMVLDYQNVTVDALQTDA